MNKGDLVESVASQMGETKAQAHRAVDAVLKAIAEGIAHEDKVVLSGFGTFRKAERKARAGVHPATRERVEIPAGVTVRFTAADNLKDRAKQNGHGHIEN